jgi:hypothetical protein
LDPYLQDTPFTWWVRALTGFAARARQGAFGAGCKIQSQTVSGYITPIGQTIALASGTNPVKMLGSDKFLTRLQQTLDGWRHEDPLTLKKLPVASDVPKFLVNKSGHRLATALDHAVADLTTIVFYYLLQIGEYMVKGTRNETKCTVQFKMEDVLFFKKDKHGRIMCLSRNAPIADILSADGATLKLDNQKNGHKGVCVYQQTTGNPIHCPVHALGRQYQHLRENKATNKTFICAYWMDEQAYNVIDDNISKALKQATATLQYPLYRGIPIKRIDTHSLRIGGACALALNGFSEMHIQKMGWWRSDTFKEYVHEELHCFSDGMAKAMKQCFKFVNVTGHALTDITSHIINEKLE